MYFSGRSLSVLLLFLLILTSTNLFAASITLKSNATWTERAAAGDLQRVIYAATGKLLPISTGNSSDLYVIAIGHSAGNKVDLSRKKLGDQGFVLKTIKQGKKTVLIAAGANPVATSYAAYTLAEYYGAGFYLGGEALPVKKSAFSIPDLDIVKKPALKVRGVLPWYNFFDSPTTWNIEDYRFFIDQLAKSKNNFLGFHSYDYEPFCAYKNSEGNMTAGAPLVSTAQSTWGTRPMKTSEFGFGTSKYFTKEYFGADCSVGYKAPEEGIKNAQKLLANALWYAKARGVKTCVGFEVTGDPTAPGALDQLELRLKNLIKTYPMLDYVWIWEPEAMGVLGSETHQQRSDFGAYYRRWESCFTDIQDPKRKSEAVRIGIYALAAHRILKQEAPQVRMVLSAWGGDNHLRFTDFYPGFDKILPKDIIFSALDNIVVSDTVSEAYGKLPKDREFWPIPWFEFDGDQWFPQPNTKQFYNASRDALKKGADGLLGIHWRTRDVEESHAYISQFAWDTNLSYEGFYRNYADKLYGTPEAAKLLMALQDLGYRWINGSGQSECGGFQWSPAPEGAVGKLNTVFEQHRDLPHSEPLDYLTATKEWAVHYDQAAKVLHNEGRLKGLLRALRIEGRKPTDEEKKEIESLLGEARDALGSAMHSYSSRMSNRGELGVLATINTKAWADLESVNKSYAEINGSPFTYSNSEDTQKNSVSSILRLTTAFEGKPFRISAVLHCDSRETDAKVIYRAPGGSFKSAPLKFANSGRLEGAIPASDVKGQIIEYYIRAGNTTWPADAPNRLQRLSVVPAVKPSSPRKNTVVKTKGKVSSGDGSYRIGPMSVQLDWKAKDNFSSKAFKVMRKSGNDAVLKKIVVTRDSWYEDRTVEAGNTYTYTITDADSSKQICRFSGITVPEPPLPPAPKVTVRTGPNRVRIIWVEGGDEVAGYNVYRSTSLNGPFNRLNDDVLPPSGSAERMYSVNAEPDKTYFYQVRAVSLSGKEGTSPKARDARALPRNDAALLSLNFNGSDEIKTPGNVTEDGIPAIRTNADTYVQLPHQEAYNTYDELTVEFRVKLLKQGGMPVMVCHGYWNQDGYFIQHYNGGIRFFLGDVGTLDAGRLEVERWTHIAATYDGSEMAVYIDGKKVGSMPAYGMIRSCNRPLYIGRYDMPGKDYEVDGYISNFRLYSYARTAEEIKADYEACAGGK